ncbi:unnamed protein product [Ostreobium quekettii]|uniref:CDP-diacylglycerol--serine O-phosphatidyltransferase n=1 Tax=Ostreobium quekettii TaxID=121088 RepID=A0A8S1J5V1_9CHLO|nr:unnamed protein product [Ostreobium quekettii]
MADRTMVKTNSRHPGLQELDPRTAFLYTPHTVTCLVLGIGLIVYKSRVFDVPLPPDDEEARQEFSTENARRGIWAVMFVFMGYSILQSPSTAMIRPHPSFWRLVNSVAVMYLMFMVWLLFQDVNDARQFLKHLSEELGREQPERPYGGNCQLWIEGKGVNWVAIQETVLDEFVVAHILGWWAKAVMIRNHSLLWVLSIGFELLELTFQHMLPNFNECWWDSWILDVATCNLLGIAMGMWTVHYFDSAYSTYNWRGISEQPTLAAKAKRSFLQFLPHSWDNFDWGMYSGPTRCIAVFAMVAVLLAVEVQAFFLKYILWVPPRNLLNTYRLLIWFAVGLPAVREYYEFLEGRAPEGTIFNKLGVFAWLATATCLVETLVCIKFGKGLFTAAWPPSVVLCWTVGALALVATLVVWSLRLWLQTGRQKKVD